MITEYITSNSNSFATTLSVIPYEVLWLDAAAKNSSKTKDELNNIVHNDLRTFDKAAECETYIEHTVNKVILILSGSIGQSFVPLVHDRLQVLAIYLFCGNKEFHTQWSKNFLKIKAVVVHSEDLIHQIRTDIRHCQPDPFSIYTTNEERSHKDLQKENASFVWLQLFLDIVVRLNSKDRLNGKEEVVAHLRPLYSRVQSEIDLLNAFQQTYTQENSIYWYTKQGCIYSELNKALRTADWNTLIKYRCFIHDLHEQLRHVQHDPKHRLPPSIINVYRGQLISVTEIRHLRNAVGQHISVNSLFSTSKNINVGLQWVAPHDENDAIQSVLYEIEVNTHLNSLKPYASISNLSDFGAGEDEVLFMLGTIFRVLHIERDEREKFWRLKLQLCYENVQQLNELYRYRRNMLRFETDLDDLHTLLAEMGVITDVVYKVLPYHHIDRYKQGKWQRVEDTEASNWIIHNVMKLTSVFSQNEVIYNRLGLQYLKKGNFQSALTNFEAVLALQIKKYGNNHNVQVANTYHYLGRTYEMNEDYPMAMHYYKESIKIRESLCHSQEEHLNLAESYKCVSSMHYYLKDYQSAILCDEKALEIYLNIVPDDDLNKAKLYHRAGIIHEELNENEKAFDFYQKTFKIYKRYYSYEYEHDVFYHQNLLMIDINRRLLRMLNIIKKTNDVDEFEEYYRKYNYDRKQGKIKLNGEVLSWQMNDASR